mmetsp:Transcript_5668/g.17811  ORF Transcript_5668/g.17811 Transcript_5668/m.17811 type:complete len:328 (-) Transcript_5668:8-991(-)
MPTTTARSQRASTPPSTRPKLRRTRRTRTCERALAPTTCTRAAARACPLAPSIRRTNARARPIRTPSARALRAAPGRPRRAERRTQPRTCTPTRAHRLASTARTWACSVRSTLCTTAPTRFTATALTRSSTRRTRPRTTCRMLRTTAPLAGRATRRTRSATTSRAALGPTRAPRRSIGTRSRSTRADRAAARQRCRALPGVLADPGARTARTRTRQPLMRPRASPSTQRGANDRRQQAREGGSFADDLGPVPWAAAGLRQRRRTPVHRSGRLAGRQAWPWWAEGRTGRCCVACSGASATGRPVVFRSKASVGPRPRLTGEISEVLEN